ncbi:MAG: SpoIIE family protein phosphatase [Coriobacteriia bacterium]|nr:SpoIIE family protein phosphatase [Coriobacteriia bacterium]MBS5478379.1 SpoIIE family protein phosphatase [Coriobacteriia bacterium]
MASLESGGTPHGGDAVPREPLAAKSPAPDAAVARPLLTAFSCGAAYLALVVLFSLTPLFTRETLVRPADGLGPALGLFFGAPAIVGCSVASLAGALLGGMPIGPAVLFALAQVVYLAIPRLLWRLVAGRIAPAVRRRLPSNSSGRGAAAPQDSHGLEGGVRPRFDTAGKVALYVALVLVDAGFAALTLSAFGPAEFSGVGAPLVWFLNSFVFGCYVGLPCALVLGWRRGRTLGELVVALFLVLMAAVIVGFFAIAYGPYLVDGSLATLQDWGYFISSSYLVVLEFTVAGLLFMVVVVGIVERRVSRPVMALRASATAFMGELAAREEHGGELQALPVDERALRPAAEIGDLVGSVNAMQAGLVSYVERFEAAAAERERTAAELDIAREIQLSAVPHDFSALRERYGLDVSGFLRPAREVGGDFYDVFELREGEVAFVVGDVSGKGVPASLFMMRAQGLIRACMLAHDDLGEALAAANDGLVERNDAMLFVTAFVCALDVSSGRLRYANAGHNPPSLRRGGVRTYLRARPGLVLGAMAGMPYAQAELSLTPGDEIMLYTDGVTEAADGSAALFGEARLAEALATCDAGSLAEAAPEAGLSRMGAAIEAVVSRIDAFVDGAPQADDITLVGVSWDLPLREIDLPNEDRFLDDLFAFLKPVTDDLVARNLATAKLSFDLRLVAEELFVNVCHYGSPAGDAFPVRVSLAVDERARRLFLTMRDGGVAYNPLEHATRMPTPDGPVGGLGIHLVRTCMQSVLYERDGGDNVLRMAKDFV